MMGHLILFAFTVCLLWLFYRDGKERASVSPAAWIVVVWAVIYGSRPVMDWFSGEAVLGPIIYTSSLDEGNIIEALISLTLILAGLVVLLRRGVRLSVVIRDNVWLFVFYLFWLMSVFWSDYPLITFKRLFRDLGTVVMVLVVLTEMNFGEAIKAVCARVAYVLIPLSVVLIRYYPDLGRVYSGYDRSAVMWVGVATHKNALGGLALVGALFLLWDLLDRQGKYWGATRKGTFIARILVLLMGWYLLVIANSMTSLLCALLGSALLIAFRAPSIRQRPGRLEACGIGAGVILLVLDSLFNVKEELLLSVGRDETLTTRTDIWPILMSFQDSPILGAGFNTFWAGERLPLLFEKVGGIIQAHNGYLETYLNGGLVGVGLLLALLLSAYMRIRKQLVVGIPEGSIRFVVLLLAIIYNNAEASFNKVGLLWLLTLFAIMQYRVQLPLRQAAPFAMRQPTSKPVLR
jgi:exopolysaccharide production protein ExoQ